jgi:hypothetical protein
LSYHPRHSPLLSIRSLPRWALVSVPALVIGLVLSISLSAGAGSAPSPLPAGTGQFRYYCVANGSVSAGQARGWLESNAVPHACPTGYQLTPVRTDTPAPATTTAVPAPATSTSAPAPAPSPSATGTGTGTATAQVWQIAPAGTTLPRSDAYCAARVQHFPERIATNATANRNVPPAGTNFHWGPFSRATPGLAANFAKVTGNFSGTTDEILEWAACKWGWDQNFAKAEAVRESSWHESMVGDSGHSFGILQVRASRASSGGTANDAWGGWPWTAQSTAVNADAQMAYLRACYDGKLSLGNGYHAGDAWGCIGSWYAGAWRTTAALGYISRVQADLSSQAWLGMH